MLRIYLQILVTNQGMFRSGCTFEIYIRMPFGPKAYRKTFLDFKEEFSKKKVSSWRNFKEETSKERRGRLIKAIFWIFAFQFESFQSSSNKIKRLLSPDYRVAHDVCLTMNIRN